MSLVVVCIRCSLSSLRWYLFERKIRWNGVRQWTVHTVFIVFSSAWCLVSPVRSVFASIFEKRGLVARWIIDIVPIRIGVWDPRRKGRVEDAPPKRVAQSSTREQLENKLHSLPFGQNEKQASHNGEIVMT